MKILLLEEYVLAFVLFVILEELFGLLVHVLFILFALIVDIGLFFARLKSFRLEIVAKSLRSFALLYAFILCACFLAAKISVTASFLRSSRLN
jgi:hypothetical protein